MQATLLILESARTLLACGLRLPHSRDSLPATKFRDCDIRRLLRVSLSCTSLPPLRVLPLSPTPPGVPSSGRAPFGATT